MLFQRRHVPARLPTAATYKVASINNAAPQPRPQFGLLPCRSISDLYCLRHVRQQPRKRDQERLLKAHPMLFVFKAVRHEVGRDDVNLWESDEKSCLKFRRSDTKSVEMISDAKSVEMIEPGEQGRVYERAGLKEAAQ